MRKTHKTIAVIITAIMTVTIACTAMASEAVSQETVKEVQQTLNDAGFDCGTPDGIAGNKTSEAIIEYQRSQGLEENGMITDELLASLGIVSEAEDFTNDESSPSSEVDSPAAEQMSEDLYAGKWVKIADQYEIWVPEAMDAAPIYDYIEISERHASLLYGRVDTEKPEIVLLVGTIEEYLGENPIEDTKITTEDINALLTEIQEDESYSGLTVNGIRGYYRESEVFGQGRITFISADPSCDIVITCVDQNLDENGVINNYGCWSENGHEYCMNMLLSFRKAETEAAEPEEVVETVTESVEEDTNTSESTPAEKTASSEAAASEPETELYEINANGGYDGVTDEGNHFKWFSCMKFIFYMKDGLMYEIGPYNGELVFGKLNDDMTFDESTISYLSADPGVLKQYAQLAYEVFGDLVLFEKYFESIYVEGEDTEKPDADYIEFDTAGGTHFRWNSYNKLVYVSDKDNVYQFSLLHGDLVFGKLNEDGETFKWYTSLTELETFPEIMDSAMDFMITECRVRAAEDSK